MMAIRPYLRSKIAASAPGIGQNRRNWPVWGCSNLPHLGRHCGNKSGAGTPGFRENVERFR